MSVCWDKIGVSARVESICCQEILGAISFLFFTLDAEYYDLYGLHGFKVTFDITTTVLVLHQRYHHHTICITADRLRRRSHCPSTTGGMTEVDKTELIRNTSTAILYVTMFGWLDSNGKTSAL